MLRIHGYVGLCPYCFLTFLFSFALSFIFIVLGSFLLAFSLFINSLLPASSCSSLRDLTTPIQYFITPLHVAVRMDMAMLYTICLKPVQTFVRRIKWCASLLSFCAFLVFLLFALLSPFAFFFTLVGSSFSDQKDIALGN